MRRRRFIQSTIGGATALAGVSASNLRSAQAAEAAPDREFYEWRTYRFDESARPLEGQQQVFAKRSPEHYEKKRQLLESYLKGAALPAWQRLGIGPVGVFTETGDGAGPSIHVLLTYPNIGSFAGAREHVEADADYQQAAAEHLQAKPDDPAFARIESCLMVAFAGAPKITPPKREDRILELRTYENHGEERARAKVQMFDDGEVNIFPKCGFENVFFGETLIGSDLPNLKYMLASPSLEANAASWKTFIGHPDFVRMRDDPKYADTEPKITRLYLQPTEYSQV